MFLHDYSKDCNRLFGLTHSLPTNRRQASHHAVAIACNNKNGRLPIHIDAVH